MAYKKWVWSSPLTVQKGAVVTFCVFIMNIQLWIENVECTYIRDQTTQRETDIYSFFYSLLPVKLHYFLHGMTEILKKKKDKKREWIFLT